MKRVEAEKRNKNTITCIHSYIINILNEFYLYL